MLSPKEIYDCKRLNAYFVLFYECNKGYYDGIRAAYEQAKINNNMLIRQLSKDRAVNKTPQSTIFWDMLSVIYDLSEDNPSIIYAIENHCRTNYPQINELIHSLEMDDYARYNSFDQIIKEVAQIIDVDDRNNPDNAVFFFLYYSSDILNKRNNFDDVHKMAKNVRGRIKDRKETEKLSFMFDETNDDISLSTTKQYVRWLKERKEALCEYLNKEFGYGITVDRVGEILLELYSPVLDDYFPMGIDINEGYTPNWVTRHLLIKHHGGFDWIEDLVGNEFTKNKDYKPDINNIIDTYYKVLASEESFKKHEFEGEAMSRMYLAREFKTDPKTDIINMAYMYNIDVVLKMFDQMVEEYYRNFSWEQISHQPLMARYYNTISDLQRHVNEQETKIKTQADEIASLKKQITEGSNSATRPYIEENLSLIKKLESRDEENARLKSKIQSMEELISLQSEEDEEDEKASDIVNIEALQSKRYLFVGYNDVPAIRELKKQFPNSLFMESETFNISSNINVDAVVILIRSLSHAMYYKVISSKVLMDLPIVRVNTKNINTVYRAIQNI